MSTVLLEVKNVSAAYGKVVALDDVSINVNAGEIVAVIGPNGAGKTSLLRAIAGFGREAGHVSHGQIWFDGKRIDGRQPHEIAREGVLLVPERDKVFTELTVAENLALSAPVAGREKYRAELDRVMTLFPPLKNHFRRRAGYLSGGERQMLSLASTLCAMPRVLLVDELSQGLAPAVTKSVSERLRAINAQGMTIVLVEQNATLAASLAHRMYILDSGRLVAGGSPKDLSVMVDVSRTYLGVA